MAKLLRQFCCSVIRVVVVQANADESSATASAVTVKRRIRHVDEDLVMLMWKLAKVRVYELDGLSFWCLLLRRKRRKKKMRSGPCRVQQLPQGTNVVPSKRSLGFWLIIGVCRVRHQNWSGRLPFRLWSLSSLSSVIGFRISMIDRVIERNHTQNKHSHNIAAHSYGERMITYPEVKLMNRECWFRGEACAEFT